MTIAALLTAACAVLGATGCGDSDESDDSANATTQTAPPATGDRGGAPSGADNADRSLAITGGGEEGRAGAASVDDVYEGFGAAVEAGVATTDVPAIKTLEAADGNESLRKVCDLMSEEAKHQTVVYAERSAGIADVQWTCEKATGLLLRRASQSGGLEKSLRARVVGVNVEGDRATASVRFGGKGAIATIPLVKEDGAWKLAASPSAGDGK